MASPKPTDAEMVDTPKPTTAAPKPATPTPKPISNIDQALNAYIAKTIPLPGSDDEAAPKTPANPNKRGAKDDLGGSSKRPRQPKSDRVCSHCHKRGHIKSDCPEKAAENQRIRAEGASIINQTLTEDLNKLKVAVTDVRGSQTVSDGLAKGAQNKAEKASKALASLQADYDKTKAEFAELKTKYNRLEITVQFLLERLGTLEDKVDKDKDKDKDEDNDAMDEDDA